MVDDVFQVVEMQLMHETVDADRTRGFLVVGVMDEEGCDGSQ